MTEGGRFGVGQSMVDIEDFVPMVLAEDHSQEGTAFLVQQKGWGSSSLNSVCIHLMLNSLKNTIKTFYLLQRTRIWF